MRTTKLPTKDNIPTPMEDILYMPNTYRKQEVDSNSTCFYHFKFKVKTINLESYHEYTKKKKPNTIYYRVI